MKKKVILFTLSSVLLLGLAACNNGGTSSSSESGSSSEPTSSDTSSGGASSSESTSGTSSTSEETSSSESSSGTSSTSEETSSSESSSEESSSSVDPIEHREDFVKNIASDAITRDYDERFDVIVEDFSSASSIAGTTTGHTSSAFMRSVIDNQLDSFPGDAGSALYKAAAGTYESMNFGSNGIGFSIRVAEGEIALEDLVLELRGDDAYQTYAINLAEALNSDAEANPELTDEYQDIVVNPGQTIEDSDTVYLNTDGTESTVKVLDKIVGFHLRAVTGKEISAIIEINEVFTYSGATRVTLDNFNREDLNKVPDAWWGGNDSGCSILVRKGVTLAAGQNYETPVLSEEQAGKTHIAMALLGTSEGATLEITSADSTVTSVAWADLKVQTEYAVPSLVNGAFYNFTIDLSSYDDVSKVKLVAQGEIHIAKVFMTSFEEPSLTLEYPHLDTENAVIFDNFNRTISSLGTDWEASAALEANIQAGINGFVSYNHGDEIFTDGDALNFPAGHTDSDYSQVTIGSSRWLTGARYVAFAIDAGEADLSNFRFSFGSSETIWFNSAYAAEGVKTYNDDVVTNPYTTSDGYTWYVVDLQYHNISMDSNAVINMYYSGEYAFKVGAIFLANEADPLIESVVAPVSVTADTSAYYYVGGIDGFDADYLTIEVQGDGIATLDSLRIEYAGQMLWMKDNALDAKINGESLAVGEVIPRRSRYHYHRFGC